MNIQETSQVLAKIQAFDNRRIDEAVIQAWQEALDRYTLADCLDAVTAHYRSNARWIMPAHIIERVEEVEQDRCNAVGTVHLNDRDEARLFESGQWADYNRALHRAVATGNLHPDAYEAYHRDRLHIETVLPQTKAINK